jgi:hypothetical protein
MACENLENMNLDKGSFCFNGEIDGFAAFDSTITVANTSLKTQAWWDAQIYDSTNRVVTLVGTDDSEITAAEVVTYEPKRGFKVQTSKGSNEYMLKFKDTECLRKTLFPLDNTELFTYFFTVNNYIRGEEATNTTTKAVKSQISVSAELADGVNLIVVKFTFATDFEQTYVEVPMEEGFNTSELTGLTGVYLEGISADATTDIVVDAYDCARTALTGLTDANFQVFNTTDDPSKASAISITNVAAVANRYTITIAVQDSGDTLWIEVPTPSSTNLYVTGKPTTVTIP